MTNVLDFIYNKTCMHVHFRVMISFKIIKKVDGVRSEDYISVNQSESLFDCLHDKIAGCDYWTKFYVRENGVDVLGWMFESDTGFVYPPRGQKDRLDNYFQTLYTRHDRPTLEILLSYGSKRQTFVRVPK
jgi:hypothetical protein